MYLGDFSDSEMLLLASIARLEGPLAAGINIKFIRQAFTGLKGNLGATSASGIGADVGLIARFWTPVRIGVMLRGKTDMENDRVPTSATVGVAYEQQVGTGILAPELVVAVDLEQVKNRPIRLHLGLGLERLINFQEFGLSIRFGRNNHYLEKRLADNLTDEFRRDLEAEDMVDANARWGIGFGIERKGLSLDYTFSRGMLHDPYYISLSYQY